MSGSGDLNDFAFGSAMHPAPWPDGLPETLASLGLSAGAVTDRLWPCCPACKASAPDFGIDALLPWSAEVASNVFSDRAQVEAPCCMSCHAVLSADMARPISSPNPAAVIRTLERLLHIASLVVETLPGMAVDDLSCESCGRPDVAQKLILLPDRPARGLIAADRMIEAVCPDCGLVDSSPVSVRDASRLSRIRQTRAAHALWALEEIEAVLAWLVQHGQVIGIAADTVTAWQSDRAARFAAIRQGLANWPRQKVPLDIFALVI